MSALALGEHRRRRGVSTLVSIALHGILLLWISGLSLRQAAPPRELIRVSLTSSGQGGGGRSAAVVGPPEVQGPPAPVPPPVGVKPAASPQRKSAPPQRSATVRRRAPIEPAPMPQDQATLAQGRGSAASDSGTSLGPSTASSTASGAGGGGDGRSGSGGGGLLGEDELEQYLLLVRARIEASKQYPLRARRARVEGRAAVRFVVSPDGRPRDLRLSQADHPLLGDAALQTVAAAAPFPRLPKGASGAPLEVEVPLRFQLEKEN